MVRTRAALVALLAGCLLAGCSDNDPQPKIADPTTSAPTSAPVSVSTSPTSTPSVSAGPKETVEAWVEAWNQALETGDAGTLAQYETTTCRNCDQMSGVIDTVISAGGSFKGGKWSIVSSKVVGISEHRVKVNAAVNVSAGSTIKSAGEDPVNFPADNRIVVYELEKSSGWLIDAIELLS